MYFQIRQVILWRRGGNGRRTLTFELGMVNVISGASKTGKSAMIPIIDYCLGSDKCSIPSGVIRDNCEWFGLVIDTVEGTKLIARREPGGQKQTGDMFVIESSNLEVPDRIEEKNSNSTIVKSMLDRVAGLSNLSFDPDSESGYRSRPSFRDLVAFTFQPQNIIANPDVLFFKADTTEHREKLKTIFPYVLNAVTPADLAARFEIERLQRILRRKEAELAATLASVNVWRAEAQGWLRQAGDLGLLPTDAEIPEEWPDILDRLRSVAVSTSRRAAPSIRLIEKVLSRLDELRKRESSAADKLSEHRQRLNELRRLVQSSGEYGSAIRVQRDRLSLSKWLREKTSDSEDVIAYIASRGHQNIDSLIQALEGLELQLRSHPAMSDTLDREQLRLRGEAEKAVEDLASVRQEMAILERDSKAAREAAYGFDKLERFLGRLQQALTIYDRADTNADLRLEVEELKTRIEKLRGQMSDYEILRRVTNARNTIEAYAASIVPNLNAEWRDAAVRLVIADLTIKVVRGNRDDFLWEIGSGANWLAFHIATTLSLQRFFLETPHHPVPGLLIFDQPSQVYFPRRTADEDGYFHTDLGDEDITAVRQVFVTLASEVLRAKGRLQVFVLDHAGVEVWGDIPGVTLTEEWRDGIQKLVPIDWIKNSPNGGITGPALTSP
jgi:Protein of unknown function (DUF3732)